MGQMNRKRPVIRCLAVVLVVAMLLTIPSAFSAPVAADEVADKRAEIAALQKEQEELAESIKKLGDDIKDQQTKVNALYKQVDNLEKQVEAYETQISLVDEQIAGQTARIETLQQEIADKEAQVAEILTKLKKRVKAITKTGNYSSFQLLMNTANYEDYLLKSKVIACVSDHDDQLRDRAEAEKQAVALKKQEAEAEKNAAEANKAELEALKAELDTQFASLDALYRQAYKEQEALEKTQGTYEDRQKKLKKAEEELEKEIEELLNTATSATYGGKMYWPVPAAKQISCTYGQKPTYFHGGTDIWSSNILKKPIVAAADGVVVKAVNMHYSYGNYVMVDHGLDEKGRRIMTLYAHMYTTPSVKVGQQVVGGKTQLGLVGSTGNSTGPHLHFEVRVDGTRVDPIGNGYIVKPK